MSASNENLCYKIHGQQEFIEISKSKNVCLQPPKPISRWRHVYDATYPRDDCVQYSFYEKKIVGSEDCLYLNIFISEVRK